MKKGWKRFWITSGAIAGIGVLFLILGFILGVSFSKINFSFLHIFPLSNRMVTVKESEGQTGEEKTFEGVKNLEIDVDHMSVYLKPSQNGKVCVGTEDIDERANLQIYKEGNTLNIETDLENNRINQAGTIILYLPQDVKFYEMDISVGAGSLKSELQSVHAENADVAVAAGAAEIVMNSGQIKYGLGSVTTYLTRYLNTMHGSNFASRSMHNDLVQMYLECGVGSATLVLHGEQEDYNYSLECGMGEVKIADGSYSGIAVEQQIDHGASKNLNIECGMGSVNVKFEK